jgi:dihydrodipicolinate synthase/N-acetylneuraminate lyase
MSDRIKVGVCPPAITIFTKDGAVDLKATNAHVDWLIENGVHGIISGGTCGEFFSMEYEERAKLADSVIEHVAGRIPVYVGVSDSSTERAVRLAKNAEAAGAAGVMSLPPYFGAMTETETRRFLERVSGATKLPFVLYNNPSAIAHIALSVEQLAKYANDGVAKIVKDTQGDAARVHELRSLVPDDVSVLYGADFGALEGIFAGADGWTAGVGNFMPAQAVEFWNLMQAEKYAEARVLWKRLLTLVRMAEEKDSYGAGDERSDYIQIYKAALDMIPGTVGGPVREPLLPLPEPVRAKLESALREAAIL